VGPFSVDRQPRDQPGLCRPLVLLSFVRQFPDGARQEETTMANEPKVESSAPKVKKERKPRVKPAPKTKEQKRAAWRAYYKKNADKYLAWSRGWRSGSKLTPQEFNKKWDADHAKAEKK